MMTNEEAIKILNSKMDGSVDTSYEWAETVRMAIKALSTEAVHGEWSECTGCEHYDQQQTSLICRECKRYYSDKHSDRG